MQDKKQTNKDVRRIIAVFAGLSSINQLKSDDVLGDLSGVGLDRFALESVYRNLNNYIELIRKKHEIEPNENDLEFGSEFNGSLTVKQTVNLVNSKLQ